MERGMAILLFGWRPGGELCGECAEVAEGEAGTDTVAVDTVRGLDHQPVVGLVRVHGEEVGEVLGGGGRLGPVLVDGATPDAVHGSGHCGAPSGHVGWSGGRCWSAFGPRFARLLQEAPGVLVLFGSGLSGHRLRSEERL